MFWGLRRKKVWQSFDKSVILQTITTLFLAVKTEPCEKDTKTQSSVYRELAPYLSLGYQLVAPAGLLGAVGWWIDGKYGTRPLWLAIGLGFGCIVGLTTIIRTVMQSDKKR
ncbi:hypothetical protein MASR2M18_07580 [Ignavibacteria bacterium]|jgi:F0F1-type ATP synthase assembly protein I|nr:AtpZ/AtpI family protein [Bacteroidota bacterium]MCZ2132728.1 AtpZ/AtpI family protein [Bacteroidota bacterium]